MKEFETTMTEKGQVTIPQEIRHLIGLRPRDRVRFEVEGNVVRIRRAESKLLAGFGAVPPRKKPEDYKAVREKVEQSIAEEAATEAGEGR